VKDARLEAAGIRSETLCIFSKQRNFLQVALSLSLPPPSFLPPSFLPPSLPPSLPPPPFPGSFLTVSPSPSSFALFPPFPQISGNTDKGKEATRGGCQQAERAAAAGPKHGAAWPARALPTLMLSIYSMFNEREGHEGRTGDMCTRTRMLHTVTCVHVHARTHARTHKRAHTHAVTCMYVLCVSACVHSSWQAATAGTICARPSCMYV
jgi:hypothetical protein